MKLSGN